MRYNIINCSHCDYITSPWLTYFITGNLYLLISSPVLPHSPPLTTYLFSVSMSLAFSFFFSFTIPHISEIMWNLSFYAWLTSFSVIPSRSAHPCYHRWQDFVLFYGSNIPLCMCITSSPIIGHLGCFHILAVVNNAAVNIGVHISFWSSVFVFFGWIPRRRISGSQGSCVYNFLRNLLTVFQGGCTKLYSQQCTGVPLFPCLCQFLLFFFLIITILTCVSWYFIVVLICISLICNDDEYIFMYLLVICMSSVECCLFRSTAHFLIA